MIASRPPRTPRVRRVLLTVGLAVLASWAAAPAAGHDALVDTQPADGATLERPPTEVVLTFSADQLDLGTHVQVVDPAGQDRAVGDPEVSGQTVRQALDGEGAPGEWSVSWRSVANDGHPVTGELGFVVLDAALPEDGSAPADAGVAGAEGSAGEAGTDEEAPGDLPAPGDVPAPDDGTSEAEGPGGGVLALAALGAIGLVLTVLVLLRRVWGQVREP